MQVISKINLDMGKKSNPPIVYAMQNDVNSRVIEVSLFSDSVSWNVPTGVSASVAFKNTSDGHKGWYDTLPDGSPACSISDNTVQVILAPAVVSSSGEVNTVIVFQDVNLNQLATFNFSVIVEKNPAADISISNDYYAYSTMEDINEAIDAILDSLEDTKAETAPAIVCEASGNTISVSDASNRTLQGLTLYGKTTQDGTPTPESPVALQNAMSNKNYLPSTEYTSMDAVDNIMTGGTSRTPVNLPAGDYTLAFDYVGAGMKAITLYFYGAGSGIATLTFTPTANTAYEFTLPSVATEMRLQVREAATITNAKLTAHKIGVTVAGKNLFPKASAGVLTKNGITFTSNGDGSYSVKGTAENNVSIFFPLEENCVFAEGIYVHLMNNVSAGYNAACVFWFSDGTTSSWAFSQANRIGAPSSGIGKTITQIGVSVQSGYTVDVTFSPMLVFSNIATDFEPYKSIQTLTASTPNGLPGIPVSSGGNYTDESGQRWICDEIDFARGVYVQRVEILDNPTTWIERLTTNTSGYTRLVLADNALKASASSAVGAVMCSIAPAVSIDNTYERVEGIAVDNTNGYVVLYNNVIAGLPNGGVSGYLTAKSIKVLYALATPIETALPAAELAAYAALHTNKPNTTVLNDSGAGMAVGYVADTKAYIDNKFNELSATLTALTGV